MANKKNVEKRMQSMKEKELLLKRKKLRAFPLISLAIAVILLLLLLTDWAAVYNTDMAGNEVSISGFNCVSAGLSGNYTSTDQASFGDMAVPFNYYAGTYVRTLSALSVAVMFVLIAHILTEIFAAITNKQGAFNPIGIAFAAAEAGLLIGCYAVALSMKNAEILSGYCNNNPACSIHSQAILPALFALLSLAAPILALLQDGRYKKAIKAEAEASAQAQKKGKIKLGKRK